MPSEDTIVTCSPITWDSWGKTDSRPHAHTTHVPTPNFLRWLGGQGAQSSKPRVPSAFVVVGAPTRTRRKARVAPQSQSQPRPFLPDTAGWPELKPDDPLDVTQIINRYLSKKNRNAVGSVHDLASVIVTCCVDVFDPYIAPETYLFFDFFEQSLGVVVRLYPFPRFFHLITQGQTANQCRMTKLPGI